VIRRNSQRRLLRLQPASPNELGAARGFAPGRPCDSCGSGEAGGNRRGSLLRRPVAHRTSLRHTLSFKLNATSNACWPQVACASEPRGSAPKAQDDALACRLWEREARRWCGTEIGTEITLPGPRTPTAAKIALVSNCIHFSLAGVHWLSLPGSWQIGRPFGSSPWSSKLN